LVAQSAGPPPHPQLLLSGTVPPLADAYYQRPETGLALRGGLYPGDTVVLTHDGEAEPAARGGTGKTQLAVAYAHALWSLRAVEVLVWVTATDRAAIMTSFAEAAAMVGAEDRGLATETAALGFVAWLARSARPWAVVIDDLDDPDAMANLWPAGPAGQVVITTPRPDVRPPGPGARFAPVGGFNRREALSYLSARLTDYPDQRTEALELGEDLAGLPLSLAQATGVMKARGLSCRDYRVQFAERRGHLSGVQIDGVGATVLATWSLAAECAHDLAPAGLAWPALALTAMFGRRGVPGAVLTSPAACGYIAGRPSIAIENDQVMVRAAITNLARVGLVSIDGTSDVRTVRMQRCVQAAVRAYLPPGDLDQALLAAADALLQTWPDASGGAQLDQAFRDCASALWSPGDTATTRAGTGAGTAGAGTAGAGTARAGTGGAGTAAAGGNRLWQPQAHPLLFRQGVSLEESGLRSAAIGYWQAMLAASTRWLGGGHANAVVARDRLAAAYESAGRFDDAIMVFRAGLADRERDQGFEHPDTIRARGHLAHAYSTAGRPAEAVALYEQMIAAATRQLGVGHPVTLTARSHLAEAYLAAGRAAEAFASYRMLVTDAERILGASHPVALAARENLAAAYLAHQQADEAIEQYRRLLADLETAARPDRQAAITARLHLASAYRQSGRPREAIAFYRQALADSERHLGPEHPMTRTVRANLEAATRPGA
jgi:tetratricopeptide (TPR) repeat protein